MRAEEGDESVKDYAIEGEQALDRIKKSTRSDNPLARAVGWVRDRLPGASRA
ncbi:hypothetical protein [Mycobacterium kiyosense]|uniref:Uncharacterized protein n=1 Tax=Mycobacterium kiyosense TaxID=2871094 RepID=A0A9P3UUR6_9MYCO|nr:hypothetical protein [Mycobacterium kiyosense]GLB84838.1 hypothetical protein SRL2020028_40940 [Mycobacterium kiyosense]GLB95901.1 hypothetical protein SRL2020226_26770 [Mycobacterium kiyosense]GLD31020.1 hypothetical protein Mkiyose1413_29030 [Mycobacterium kiyosense]GLD36901.1 hypothetical protein Mkiyose1595_31210 [Mycobacterium kiyosense]